MDDEQDVCVEASFAETGTAAGHGFGEKDSSSDSGSGEKDFNDDVDSEDVECQAETGSLHSVTSDDRHDLAFIANKKCKFC